MKILNYNIRNFDQVLGNLLKSRKDKIKSNLKSVSKIIKDVKKIKTKLY